MNQATTKKRLRLWQRILIIALAVIIALVAALSIAIGCVWGDEISTVSSFKKLCGRNDEHLDGSVYRMDVKGGFYFDDYLAQGGAASDSALIDFITRNITKGLVDLSISETEIGCASFTAAAENGDRLFARNYDFSKTNTCLVFTKPGNGRYASVSSVDLQFIGMDADKDVGGLMNKITCLAAPYAPLDGMNEMGVACGIYMTYQGETTVPTDQNTDKPDLTSTTMLRMILDYADSVDKAVELISQYDLHDSASTSYHYMVADSTGKSAILEWVYGTDKTDNDGSKRELVVTYNTGDGEIGEAEASADYQWVTNFIIQPGYYETDEGKAGLDRYERIYERLSPTDGVVADEAAAMSLLGEIGRRSWENDDGNGCTVHSVVYNLTKKTALWVPNEHYGDPAYTFTFSL